MKKKILLFTVLTISFAAAFAQTGDPWIKQIYNTNFGREPTVIEYNIQNYNGGHWNNYGELQKYVSEYLTNMAKAGISTKISAQTFPNNTKLVAWYQNGQLVAADLVAQGGGNIVAQGGGNIVAQGGGNIVAQGGGNIVAQGGGNIVAQGGGNIMLNTAAKGAGFGGAYTVQSEGTKVVKASGSTALIFR